MIFLANPVGPWGRPGPGNGFTVGYALMTPSSRRSVRSDPANPEGPPRIDPNYLADERDVVRLVVGLRRAREVGETRALSPWRDRELIPGPAARDDDELREAVRQNIGTLFHAVGTCRIGVAGAAVVDPELRVHASRASGSPMPR